MALAERKAVDDKVVVKERNPAGAVGALEALRVVCDNLRQRAL